MLDEGHVTEVKLPPGPGVSSPAFAAWFLFSRPRVFAACVRRYGRVFSLTVPLFGRSVVIADAALAKELFAAPVAEIGRTVPNLDSLLGSGSIFALDGQEHRNRRRLLTPPFHGKSVKNYVKIFEEETLRETQNWPMGQQFATYPSMMRITLSTILRSVFGAGGAQLQELREVLPAFVGLGSRLTPLPTPESVKPLLENMPCLPWGRLAAYRRRYEAVIDQLIVAARTDPQLDSRSDIFALLLRSRYADGSAMSRTEIGDELLTLLAAGHETTAATLGCTSILFALSELHPHRDDFPQPHRFMPERFIGRRLPSAWAPYGGGMRRCVGANFANIQMDVILRTILRHFDLQTTTAPDEKMHSRGITYTLKAGARAVVRRRADSPRN